MKLISNWKKCWRMFSVQAMTIAAAIQGAWVYTPDDMRATIPSEWVQLATITLLVLGVIGRLFTQKKVSGE